MKHEIADNLADEETAKDLEDLQLAKNIHSFAEVDLDTLQIIGDVRDREYVLEQCRHTLTLCELYDIKPEMMGIHGTVPIVWVDLHPNRPKGSFGKFGEIAYRDEEYRDGGIKPTEKFVADFDITVWDVPAVKIENSLGHAKWEVRI